jgi:hypothetical protein
MFAAVLVLVVAIAMLVANRSAKRKRTELDLSEEFAFLRRKKDVQKNRRSNLLL